MSLIDLGNVMGPTGATGPQGPVGPKGPKGPKGDTGEWSGASNLIYTDGVTVETSDTPIS